MFDFKYSELYNSKHGPKTSNMDITWEHDRHAESQGPTWMHRFGIYNIITSASKSEE